MILESHLQDDGPKKEEVTTSLVHGTESLNVSGKKRFCWVISEYFSYFRVAAASSTAPAQDDVMVSVAVTSHKAQRPSCRGMRV